MTLSMIHLSCKVVKEDSPAHLVIEVNSPVHVGLE